MLSSFSLHVQLIRNQWQSHCGEGYLYFIIKILLLLCNNLFFCFGAYGITRRIQSEGLQGFSEIFISSGIILLAWSSVKLFWGGWLRLDENIQTGAFELCMLSKYSPLLVASLENPNFLMSLAEFIQGVLTWSYLSYVYGMWFGGKQLLAALNSALAFMAFLILRGAVSFSWYKSKNFFRNMQIILIQFSVFFHSFPKIIIDGFLLPLFFLPFKCH